MLNEYVEWNQANAICRHLYCEDKGEPVTNYPRKISKVEVLQYLYGWTDREIMDMYDITFW